MTFLRFQYREQFKTSSSMGFQLIEPTAPADMPVVLRGVLKAVASVVSVVGTIELHYPASGHIKAYMRVVLPINLAKEIERTDFRNAVENFLHERNLPQGVTYEADLIPYSSFIIREENRMNTEGKTDGVY